MATKKKNVKKKASAGKKKTVASKKSKSVSTKSRKISLNLRSKNAKTAKSKLPVKTNRRKITAANRKPSATSDKKGKGETVRIFRSSLPTHGEVQGIETVDLEDRGRGADSAGQSGSLQGLSGLEGADSESVGELLEEGNSFEAEIVKGVEDAPDADESEVRTHQRPQEKDLDEDFREN
jgi:hypothetical protein